MTSLKSRALPQPTASYSQSSVPHPPAGRYCNDKLVYNKKYEKAVFHDRMLLTKTIIQIERMTFSWKTLYNKL